MEIIQYNPVKAEIEALKTLNTSLVFDYDSPSGNKNARSHVYKLRQKKADVERVRKAAKADALEYGRRVDAVANELSTELDSMIVVHQKPLDEIEAMQRAEQERKEREEAEAKAEAERIEREKQEAILAAERAEAAKVKAELDAMRRNFYGFDPSYHVARYHFVARTPHSWTPRHLARHRDLDWKTQE